MLIVNRKPNTDLAEGAKSGPTQSQLGLELRLEAWAPDMGP